MTRARPIQSLRRSRGPVAGLYQIAHAVNSGATLHACLDVILAVAQTSLGVERASLMLLDARRRQLRVVCERGLRAAARRAAVRVGEGVAGWVAKTGRPLLLRDLSKDRRFIGRNAGQFYTRSLLTVPLKVRSRTIGVLNVNNKRSRRAFTVRDRELLETLATEAAVAIDRARLHEELRRANHRMHELDRVKSRFLANVSHELHAPLGTVRYLISLVAKGAAGETTADQRRHLQVMEDNVGRLARLIGNLLDLSRLDAGRFTLQRSRRALRPVVDRVMEALEKRAQQRGIALSWRCPESVPAVYGDEDRLVQVVTNLVENAVKYTPAGGRVAVEVEAADHQVELRVRDTGPGIPPAERRRIFEAFHRVDEAPHARVPGTGLGLAVAKEIVGLHGGRLWVESRVGRGSTFYVRLPVYDEERILEERVCEVLRVARRGDLPCSLVLLGIPGFREWGRRVGPVDRQAAVATLEARLQALVRSPGDLVVAFEHGEFPIVLLNTARRGALSFSQRLSEQLAGDVAWVRDEPGRIACAVVTYPDDGRDARQLIRAARRALEEGQHGDARAAHSHH